MASQGIKLWTPSECELTVAKCQEPNANSYAAQSALSRPPPSWRLRPRLPPPPQEVASVLNAAERPQKITVASYLEPVDVAKMVKKWICCQDSSHHRRPSPGLAGNSFCHTQGDFYQKLTSESEPFQTYVLKLILSYILKPHRKHSQSSQFGFQIRPH